jgi:hypothetical protein
LPGARSQPEPEFCPSCAAARSGSSATRSMAADDRLRR